MVYSYVKKLFIIVIATVTTLSSFADSHPFDYDLKLTYYPGKNHRTMLCFHGMGADYRFAKYIQTISDLDDNFVGFNFRDHEITKQLKEPENTIYGTIEELLPAVYVLKKIIVDEKREVVNIYAFSMGGAALINTLALLNTDKYDQYLESLKVTQEDKIKILEVLQKGCIILDCPLKSMREIIETRGENRWVNAIGARFRENDLEPIDSLKNLKGLHLPCFVHFQTHDEYLSNRDDQLYIDTLKKYNKGPVIVTSNGETGHTLPHNSLWLHYHMEQKKSYTLIKEKPKFVIGKKIRTSGATHAQDVKALWKSVQEESLLEEIPHRMNEFPLAVYSNYEGNGAKSYDYLIGYEVSSLDQIPSGMSGVKIPKGSYGLFKTKGAFPRSLTDCWKDISISSLKRSYHVDYEIYPENFPFTEDTKVEVHISAKG